MNGRGATLLEVAVAVLLLGVGAMALAGSIVHSLRAREKAVGTALAAVSAEAWIERWRGGPWRSGAETGTAELVWGARRGRLEWSLFDLGACLQEARVRAVTGRRSEVAVLVETRRHREGSPECGD
ncbi:MAG: type IV pilus modification PilV family protein [Gemmatimonadota bacterium]